MQNFEEKKNMSVLVYLLHKGGGSLGLYELVKLVYFADKK